MRVFAAVDLAAPAAEHLDGALEGIRESAGSRLRWVHPAQWHLTLAFYGQVPDGSVPDLMQALTATAAMSRAMTLRLSGAGSFTGRTLWMGVAGADRADERGLVDLMASCGELTPEPDRRRRRGHLTVARTGRRSDGTELPGLVRALSVYRGPAWSVPQVCLYSSELGAGPGGSPRYELVGTAPLGHGGGSGTG
ncbi:RNA 2',3'-cyclic phosphodiesterase [Pseudactinotalea sp. Z1739]|uniref:RNA 2',3'-cyclic phosphodiesterase n=1 Tax=Pseudactinotalea sp. Z1739 TaxID=3413028 RepID=UPI003C7C6ADF